MSELEEPNPEKKPWCHETMIITMANKNDKQIRIINNFNFRVQKIGELYRITCSVKKDLKPLEVNLLKKSF